MRHAPLPLDNRPTGIYVHIPFCASLCPYCDFAVFVRRDPPFDDYVSALLSELHYRIDNGELDQRNVNTLYLGGGTPSLLPKAQLSRLADTLRHTAPNYLEWTIEANPLDITPGKVDLWRDLGITRVSLGVQSFDDAYLRRLGRKHQASQAVTAVKLLLNSGLDLSLDLIFAGPSHTLDIWERDLAVVETLTNLPHLSAYHLTVEPNTQYFTRLQKNKLPLPDDDQAATMLERLGEACRKIGLVQYEVSSYAKPGHESLHNTTYWIGAEYLGIGVGAHGLLLRDEVVRTSNPRPYRQYIECPTTSRQIEIIDPTTYLAERLFTGLRTSAGIDFEAIRRQFDLCVPRHLLDLTEELLNQFVANNFQQLVIRNGDPIFTPTPKGFLFADHLAKQVFDALL